VGTGKPRAFPLPPGGGAGDRAVRGLRSGPAHHMRRCRPAEGAVVDPEESPAEGVEQGREIGVSRCIGLGWTLIVEAQPLALCGFFSLTMLGGPISRPVRAFFIAAARPELGEKLQSPARLARSRQGVGLTRQLGTTLPCGALGLWSSPKPSPALRWRPWSRDQSGDGEDAGRGGPQPVSQTQPRAGQGRRSGRLSRRRETVSMRAKRRNWRNGISGSVSVGPNQGRASGSRIQDFNQAEPKAT